MLIASSLGEVLTQGLGAARLEVLAVRSMRGYHPRIPVISEVTVKLVQPLFGAWEKSFSYVMAGGTIPGLTFELEDTPVPKAGKILVGSRVSPNRGELGAIFAFDARPNELPDSEWQAARASLVKRRGKSTPAKRAKRGKRGEAKTKRPRFDSALLRRPVSFFAQDSGDPQWPGTYPTTVTLEVWDNTSDLGAEEAFTSIQRAINTWNNAGSTVSIRNVVRSGGMPIGSSDQRMIMRWSPTGPPAQLAVTTRSSDPNTGDLLDADIQFWENQTWSTTAAAGTFDIESVALHELGHFLGLSHSAGATDVMQPAIPAATTRTVLSAADVAALRAVYQSRPVAPGLIYRWWKPGDHFYTPSPYGELAPDVDYEYEAAVFRLFPAGTAGTTRFYRWINLNSAWIGLPADNADHFYTADPNGEFAFANGYIYEGSIGNIATTQISNTLPLFRWRHPGTGDHFYTIDPTGELAPAQGYVSEGVAGFVLPP